MVMDQRWSFRRRSTGFNLLFFSIDPRLCCPVSPPVGQRTGAVPLRRALTFSRPLSSFVYRLTIQLTGLRQRAGLLTFPHNSKTGARGNRGVMAFGLQLRTRKHPAQCVGICRRRSVRSTRATMLGYRAPRSRPRRRC